MQTAAMRVAGIDATYELCDVAEAGLPRIAAAVREGALAGCNVTIPHKAAMARLCDTLEGDARTLAVVNTLVGREGTLAGHDTDAAGFERALREAGLWPEAGCRAVVFGAGGAAAAVALALTRVPASSITVVARSEQRAQQLASHLPAGSEVRVAAWSSATAAPHLERADIVVNATPAPAMALPLDIHALRKSCTVADVRYRPRPVDLVTAATARGLAACDGSAMLLHQGMLAFELWTGMAAPVEAAREALEAALR